MQHTHAREYLQQGDRVIVECTIRANVMITDDGNYAKYKSNRQAKGYGGYYKQFPAEIIVPYSGYWNTTIDLGGGSGQYRYSISYMKG